jgi:uncharacterized protein (TIGR02246 family)
MRALIAPMLILAAVPAAPARAADAAADRAEIHALLVDYGRTLDARDFDGFGRLFAKDGVYAAGNGEGSKGGAAAAEAMRRIFAANASGFRQPNFHLFFNEVIVLDDADHAHATSMSLYMAPDADNRPSPAMMAVYDDRLVREDGRWKFARRAVKGLIPAPKGK